MKINGTTGNDTITKDTAAKWGVKKSDFDAANDIDGGAGNDVIKSEGGDDTVHGGAGADSIYAGKGDDWVYGDAGNDYLDGGAGNDYLVGGAGNDKVYGGDGDDAIFSIEIVTGLEELDSSSDYISGGKGSDLIALISTGKNTVSGGDGDDTVFGGDGADSINGDSGDDAIFDGDGADRVFGGNGKDVIFSGAGSDTLTGGNGADTFLFDAMESGSQHDVITDYSKGDAIYIYVEHGYNPSISVAKQNDGFVVSYFTQHTVHYEDNSAPDEITLTESSILLKGVKNFSVADVHIIELPDIVIDPITLL